MAETDLIQFDGGALVCDLVLDSSAKSEVQLTEYPVEGGTTITDHVVRSPFKLELTLLQTQTPISPIDGFAVASQDATYDARARGKQTTQLDVAQSRARPLNLNALIGGITSRLAGAIAPLKVDGLKIGELGAKSIKVSALTADAPVERVNDFYDQLLLLLEASALLIVTVKGVSYVDMVLTSVTRTDSPGKFGCAQFQVALQQIRTVETQTVDLPPVPAATKKRSTGTKPTKTETREEKLEQARSNLLGVAQAVGLLR